ncbi:MAG: DUF4249 domain-containing protein [Arcicella sp.]|jgi:hypothetical protein|nr:DUF4249 domain-containing protein [Arcicella sp.]
MKTKVLIYFVLILLLVGSCITPINDFDQVAAKSFLTVEATLSDQPGPHRVKIFMSADKLVGSYFAPVTRAKVYITDAKGVREDFTEVNNSRGTYVSSTKFAGKIGGTYTLNIETPDGKKYQSAAETMKAVPEIENLITRFEVQDIYAKGDARRGGFNIYLDFQDPATEGDYYQWYWKHYQRAYICETCIGGSYSFTLNTCVQPRIPTEQTLSYRCDGDCWDITFSTDLNIFSDAYLNGQRITGKQVARIPYDDTTPYYLQFEQRSITANSYNYYQSLKAQVQNNGTLFDVPAETRFSFNVKSLTNPQEKILGLFDVFSVRKRIFYIDRTKGVPKDESPVVKAFTGDVFSCTPGIPNCKDMVQCTDGLYRTPFKPVDWRD